MPGKHLLHLLHVAHPTRILLIKPRVLLIRKTVCLFNTGCWRSIMGFGRCLLSCCFRIFLGVVSNTGWFFGDYRRLTCEIWGSPCWPSARAESSTSCGGVKGFCTGDTCTGTVLSDSNSGLLTSIFGSIGLAFSFCSFCCNKLCFFSAVRKKTATVVLRAVFALQSSGLSGEWSQTGQTFGRFVWPVNSRISGKPFEELLEKQDTHSFHRSIVRSRADGRRHVRAHCKWCTGV